MNSHDDFHHFHQERFSSQPGKKALRILGHVLGGIVFAVLIALLFGLVVKILWNWLMPAIFGLGVISFWQAFGIVLLAKLLFGSHGHPHKDHDRRFERHFKNHAKKFTQSEGLDEWCGHVPGNGKKWRHFRQFWQEEGRAAFEGFIKKQENQEKDKAPQE